MPLMCGNDYISVDELREKAKEFIANAGNAEHMPEKHRRMWSFSVRLSLTTSM